MGFVRKMLFLEGQQGNREEPETANPAPFGVQKADIDGHRMTLESAHGFWQKKGPSPECSLFRKLCFSLVLEGFLASPGGLRQYRERASDVLISRKPRFSMVLEGFLLAVCD